MSLALAKDGSTTAVGCLVGSEMRPPRLVSCLAVVLREEVEVWGCCCCWAWWGLASERKKFVNDLKSELCWRLFFEILARSGRPPDTRSELVSSSKRPCLWSVKGLRKSVSPPPVVVVVVIVASMLLLLVLEVGEPVVVFLVVLVVVGG